MGFSSKLKAHKSILTLETLKFISEYLVDGNARLSALRIGIPETYAARYGQWLKKQSVVRTALETELDESDLRQLQKIIKEIDGRIETCRGILGIEGLS
jgi:phage terminase small subunit